VHLALDDERVDHRADVVDGDVRADLDEAGLGVDLGRAQVGAVREGEVVRVVGGLGVDARLTPSGVLCAKKVARATSAIVTPLSGSPRTENRPGVHSRSSAEASSSPAAITLAFSTTLSHAETRAIPPTARERDP